MIVTIQKNQLAECARLIREAFTTVAAEFDLTPENCPTHPSLISKEHVAALFEKEVEWYGYQKHGKLIGLVALEQPDKSKPWWYIEKLSVQPSHRHRGIGKMLMQFALSEIKMRGGTYVSIALIAEHTILKKWYETLGFTEYLSRRYDHLPFGVCFMEYNLFQIEKTSGQSKELARLIATLDDDLRERYGDAKIHGIDLENADHDGIIFFMGTYGKQAVCCGALRPYDSRRVEVKRMFVKKEYRGKEFSKKLYRHLEQTAREMGFKSIILETGKKQFEAHGLYKKMGFSPIEKFGEYVIDENSLCFAKEL